jgi:hypothetical protein
MCRYNQFYQIVRPLVLYRYSRRALNEVRLCCLARNRRPFRAFSQNAF